VDAFTDLENAMRTFLSLSAFALLTACGNASSDPSAASSDLREAREVAVERTVRTTGPTNCMGWGCGMGARPVSDEEMFALAAKYAHATGDVAELASVECAEVTNACVYSCSVRTMCGGGGAVDADEQWMVYSWLATHSATRESVAWASRMSVSSLVCSKVAGAARCSFISGGGGGSSSGGTPTPVPTSAPTNSPVPTPPTTPPSSS
jgi:hypothetical protein